MNHPTTKKRLTTAPEVRLLDIVHDALSTSERGCYHPRYGASSCETVVAALKKPRP